MEWTPRACVRKGVLALLLVALAVAGSAADGAADPSGHWSGAIQVPGSPLDITVDLEPGTHGAWSGRIGIPAQGLKDLPLDQVSVDGARVRFRIPGIPGDPTFDGTLDGVGAIAGTFTQGGQSIPFALKRGEQGDAPVDLLADADALIESLRKDWKVPGLAVALVRDGKVALAKGYGSRDPEGKEPVTPDTLFSIGSCSKAFTATLVQMGVADGKLDLDRPVRDVLPGFRLHDPVASEHATLRDLLTHRTGLPRHDAVWYGTTRNREQLIAALPDLPSSKPFRTEWQYNNLMFMTAGAAVGKAEGTTWEDMLRQRIFGPLGMTAAVATTHEAATAADHATPCSNEGGSLHAVPFRDVEALNPAGSIHAGASAMGQWLLFNLSGGKNEKGDAILSPAALHELWKPAMPLPAPPGSPERLQPAYGMGWMSEAFRGERVVWHNGAIDGFTACVMLIPGKRAGVAVMANLDGSSAPEVVAATLVDRILGVADSPWNARAKAAQGGVEGLEQAAQAYKDLHRVFDTRPSHRLRDYAGVFHNDGYGDLEVVWRSSKKAPLPEWLKVRYNGFDQDLTHWHYDQFHMVGGVVDGTALSFVTNERGEISAVEVLLEPATAATRFTRVPGPELSQAATLEKYVGEYEIMGVTLTVRVTDGQLRMDVPGQDTATLVPVSPRLFDIAGASGYSVTFIEKDGRVSEAVIGQPQGMFPAKRK